MDPQMAAALQAMIAEQLGQAQQQAQQQLQHQLQQHMRQQQQQQQQALEQLQRQHLELLQQQQQQLKSQEPEQQQQQQQQQPSASTEIQQTTPTHREPKVRLPDPFDGNRANVRGFVTQVRLVIQQRPLTFATEKSQVGLVGSLLSDDALKWFNPLFEKNDEILNNFETFVAALLARFDDPARAATAARKLSGLKQGQRSVPAYATDFQSLLADAGYDERAACHFFRRGLREDIKDLLLVFNRVEDSLTTLIGNALECETRILERRHDTAAPISGPAHGSGRNTIPSADAMVIDAALARSGPRGPLSTEERQRRREAGACMYCGEMGHLALTCPRLKQNHPSENASGRG